MPTSFFSFFTDPILRAPTIGCMLMCLSAALVGVIAFLRKSSLLGEALSHASFPGVIIGVVVAGEIFGNALSFWLPLMTVLGAFLSSLLGLFAIHYLETKGKVRTDSALCFILSVFFGIGITLASRVQFTHSTLYKQSLSYLYGQAATMVDLNIVIYGALSLLIIAALLLFYKEVQVLTFDRDYAKSLGVQVKFIRGLIFILFTLSIVIGIRSVGVVLMSAMLIAPAVAARQLTNHLSLMLLFAGIFGLVSGYFGVYLSVALSNYFATLYPSSRISFPTGPMIVMVASLIAAISLFFAPERGLFMRFIRSLRFSYQCSSENILKAMWRLDPKQEYSLQKLSQYQNIKPLVLRFILHNLQRCGWVEKTSSKRYKLTSDGVVRSAKIVRLHRLWELYLADYLGMGVEKVHRSAEEMEHILTPEIEKELTKLLKDPKFDPHHQPIPPHEGTL